MRCHSKAGAIAGLKFAMVLEWWERNVCTAVISGLLSGDLVTELQDARSDARHQAGVLSHALLNDVPRVELVAVVICSGDHHDGALRKGRVQLAHETLAVAARKIDRFGLAGLLDHGAKC